MNPEAVEILDGRFSGGMSGLPLVWGWEVAAYLFLGGMMAGLMVLRSLLEMRGGGTPARSTALRLAPLMVIVGLSAGMGALFLDLGYKMHVYRFYMAFKPLSPMSWGSWILVLVYPAVFLLGLASLSAGERARLVGAAGKLGLGGLVDGLCERAQIARSHLVWLNLGVGLALGVYTGLLLGTLGARTLWNSAALGPLFLISGISTGAALLLLFRLEEDERHWLVRADVAAIVAELATLGLMGLDLASRGQAGFQAVSQFLGGPWTGPFWSLVVVCGLLVPLGMEMAESRRHLRPAAVVSVLVLIGGLSLRYILLMAGQAPPMP